MTHDSEETGNAVATLVLERYFAGESSPEEAVTVRRYLDAHPGVRRYYRLLRATLASSHVSAPSTFHSGETTGTEFDPQIGLQHLRHRIEIDSTVRKRLSRLQQTRTPGILHGVGIRRWTFPATTAAIATAIVVLLAVAVPLLSHGVAFRALFGTSPAPVATEYTTTRGQRATIGFGNGSRIILAPGSHLKYYATADGGMTDARLTGEAYFEIRHDPAHPFVVRAMNTTTEVLGTTFTVRAYPGDSLHVAVAEGKVAWRAAANTAPETLVQGDVVTMPVGGSASVMHGVNLDAYINWTTGTMSFRGKRFRDIAHSLERWYDVEIHFTDTSIGETVLALSLDDQPVDDAMRVIATTADIRYTRTGRMIVFGPREHR